jgi:hypothetical protein
MTSIRIELFSQVGTREEQWNISRRFALVCHMLNKSQSQYVFDNQGLLTKAFDKREDKLTLVVNKEIPLNHENDFFLSKSIPTDVEDQELKQSADLIMERVLKALRG